MDRASHEVGSGVGMHVQIGGSGGGECTLVRLRSRVSVCARACVSERVCECARARACVRECVCVRARVRA